MTYDDLPERWKEKLNEFISANGSEYSPKYRRLGANDFPSGESLKITFQDGSNAFFKYSFYLIDEQMKEVAVFTEHCGYHIFFLGEILIETLDTVKTKDYRTE